MSPVAVLIRGLLDFSEGLAMYNADYAAWNGEGAWRIAWRPDHHADYLELLADLRTVEGITVTELPDTRTAFRAKAEITPDAPPRLIQPTGSAGVTLLLDSWKALK